MTRFDGCSALMRMKRSSIVRPERLRDSRKPLGAALDGTLAWPAVHGRVCRWPERAAIKTAAGIKSHRIAGAARSNQRSLKTAVREFLKQVASHPVEKGSQPRFQSLPYCNEDRPRVAVCRLSLCAGVLRRRQSYAAAGHAAGRRHAGFRRQSARDAHADSPRRDHLSGKPHAGLSLSGPSWGGHREERDRFAGRARHSARSR